jgi:hypothetical protein
MGRRAHAGVIAAIAGMALAGLAGTAQAAAPTLLSVGQQDRHVTGTLSAAGADDVTVYMATKPDRGTDGRFLSESIKDLSFLTDDEIQRGAWLASSQIAPGIYYVMLNASTFRSECYEGADCLNGFSNVLTLSVPEPAKRYSRSITTYRFLGSVDLRLTITPLGKDQPYRVCWTAKKRKCLRGTVDGYDWNQSASDTLSVRTRGLKRLTTFAWYVNGRKVASKRVRVR